VTASLRNQRVRVFVAEEIGTDGFPRTRYRKFADAWARVEPPTGRDLSRFEGTEHTINAVITFDLNAVVPEGGMVRVLPGTDGLADYRVVAALPRRLTHEQHVYASSMAQDEQPHEVADGGPVARIVVTPATFTLAVAATQALAFTLYDADDNVVTGRVTTYESADDTIATVDAAGLVTGVAGGECAIIVQCEGVTTASVATVTSEAAVALVIISPTDFSLDFGATQQLTIVTKDAQGNVLTGRAITYQSTASSKVAVNSSGLVAASASNAGVAAIIATSEGVSGAIAVTSVDPYAAFLAYDSVTRADNPSSPGSATEKGGAWTVLSGTGWGVSGGKLVCAGASAGLIQLGSKVDPTLQADVGGVWTAHDPGPAFRILDATNFLLLTSNGLSQVRLYSSLAGSFTNLGSFTATLTNGAASTLKVAVVGTSVNVYVAGSLVGNATLTGGAASLAGTGCGLYSDAGGTTSFFDNYQVLA